MNYLEFEKPLAEIEGKAEELRALAKTGDAHKVLGSDLVDSYLLLATSYDLTFSTLAQFTSVRVVCNNTLQQSLKDYISRVSIPHFRDFNATQIHEQLGLGRAQWGAFSQALDAIAKIKLDSAKAKEVLGKVFVAPEKDITYIDPQVEKILRLFEGKAIGADIAGQCSSQDGAGLILNRSVGLVGGAGHVGDDVVFLRAHAWRSFCSALRWWTTSHQSVPA